MSRAVWFSLSASGHPQGPGSHSEDGGVLIPPPRFTLPTPRGAEWDSGLLGGLYGSDKSPRLIGSDIWGRNYSRESAKRG